MMTDPPIARRSKIQEKTNTASGPINRRFKPVAKLHQVPINPLHGYGDADGQADTYRSHDDSHQPLENQYDLIRRVGTHKPKEDRDHIAHPW
jgi:hypothetical protein